MRLFSVTLSVVTIQSKCIRQRVKQGRHQEEFQGTADGSVSETILLLERREEVRTTENSLASEVAAAPPPIERFSLLVVS